MRIPRQSAPASAFPAAPGTYVLLLALDAPCRLTVGRLGAHAFSAGWYTYVGSAQGSGGLRGRLAHHLAGAGRPHWHIDTLRAVAPVFAVWYAPGPSREHAWAAALLALPDAQLPVSRFGASDCRCPAHLFAFVQRPACPFPDAICADIHG